MALLKGILHKIGGPQTPISHPVIRRRGARALPVIESGFGWYKNMLVPAAVTHEVEHYSRVRPAFALDHRTPEQFSAVQGF